MIRAVWNGTVVAEAPRTIRLEGNDYFPPGSLRREFFLESASKSMCAWKGQASYYTLTVNGEFNTDAAWTYPKPSPLARRVEGHVAFWNGVSIEGEPESPARGLADRLPAWLGGKQ